MTAERTSAARKARRSAAVAGFTLIELLLVVAIIGIISAIALPALGRARDTANETATIGDLRTIVNAQAVYAQTCGGGSYAPSMPSLTTPPPGGASFLSAGFTANSTDQHNYRFRFAAGTRNAGAPATCNGVARGRAVVDYFMGADPLQGGNRSPFRHFGVNAGGSIYQSTSRIRAYFGGLPPPPPAAPLR